MTLPRRRAPSLPRIEPLDGLIGPTSLIVYQALQALLAEGIEPTRRRLAERAGLAGPSMAHYHIRKLIEAGLVKDIGDGREFLVLDADALVEVTIAGTTLTDVGPMARLLMEQGGWSRLARLITGEDGWLALAAIKQVMAYGWGQPKGDGVNVVQDNRAYTFRIENALGERIIEVRKPER